MRMSVFEERLAKKIEMQLPGAAPGLQVQVYQSGRKICDLSVGTTYAYYDLASLTKIIFTTQAMIWQYQQGKWNFQTLVQSVLPWFPHPSVRIVDLLNHSSGIIWHLPYFEKVSATDTHEQRWKTLKQSIIGAPREQTSFSVYSDVNFWILGFLLEDFFQKSLIEIWEEMHALFYPRLSIAFHPDNICPGDERLFAPTGKCPRRGFGLRGVVHDENAYAMGGVAAHAGLFASIDDVSWFGLFVRGQLQGISKTLIKQKTAKLFASRARPPGQGDWALGYMMPTPGRSTSGDFFSPYSIGHTGFTGTSLWYDPIQDLLVVVLSNRVAFGNDRKEFAALRPQIHNWIVEGLRRGLN